MAFTFQINEDVVWDYDEKLLERAERNSPELIDTTIKPIGIVELIPEEERTNDFELKKSSKNMLDLPEYSIGREESLILDLGDHYVGRLSIDIQSVGSPMDAPLFMKVKFAEVPSELYAKSEDYDGWLSKSWIQEEFIHVDVLPTTLELPRRYSCRYVELSIIDTSPKWKVSFSNPVFTAQSSVAMSQLPSVEIEDSELKDIYNVSVKTLLDCMQTVFEDGPKRDRRLWLGDLRLQALANYYTFNDMSLVKRCLYLFGGMTTDQGKIPANVFTEPKLTPDDTFLFDYSLFFATSLYDYFIQTNDYDVLENVYPVARKAVDLSLEQVDIMGRLKLTEEWPVFVDWSNDFEKDTAGQAIMIYTLRRMIALAEVYSDPREFHYRQVLDSMVDFSKKYLFDEENDQFIIESSGEINVASQVWMVLAEVFDKEKNKKIMQETVKNHFPIQGIATPYMYHHVVEALFVADCKEEAVKLMKEYWGEMIRLGADTFWEAFKPEDLEFSPYGSPILNSYCHAWSCTPAYLIGKYILDN